MESAGEASIDGALVALALLALPLVDAIELRTDLWTTAYPSKW